MVYNPQDGEIELRKTPVTERDTIAALATPAGTGGVGIVRVSGPGTKKISRQMLGKQVVPRRADYLPFLDSGGSVIDSGIALFFPKPHSFTGEDVLELQGHGGPVVMDLILKQVLAVGARPARPGEFSERAFLNGKMDLVQAEAIADLIASSSEGAARSAMHSLQGEFSREIYDLVERVIRLRTYIEAAIDFPEEEIDFLADKQITRELGEITRQLQLLLENTRQGCLLHEGMQVVIAGRPNAGKSSLLNMLSRKDSAIVTTIPGTTRDILREQINIDGMPVHIIDTAGLRESSDPVEQEGIRRAWNEIEKGDQLLLVVDDQFDTAEQQQDIMVKLPERVPITVIRNKIDLTGSQPGIKDGRFGKEITLSARTGAGIELLRNHLKQSVGFQNVNEGTFMARRRHLDALNRAATCLESGQRQLTQHQAGELLADDLRQVQQALGEITGTFCSEDLLDRIFSGFCIGK